MSDKVTVNVAKEYDADDLWSMIFGAAGETWNWWHSVDFLDGADWDKAGRVYLEADDPDHEGERDEFVNGTFTIDDVIKALTELADHPMVMRHLQNEDFDACSADCVMQQMLYGETVWG
jgi:hypothetical protein